MAPRTLGMKLKALREDRGLSQTALAKKVGVTQPYITMLEHRDDLNPTLGVLRKLAKVLRVPLTDLLK